MALITQRTSAVRGLADLQKAWAVADSETGKELRQALRSAAEPVRADAQALAVHTIRRNTPEWSRMKVGVTRKSVYVAPKARATRQASRKRPKFADLLATRAMQPALDRNIREVTVRVDDALATVGRKWENA